MRQRGFTLLEVLVATVIMAIAVTALLSNLSVALRTAGRVTDNDRAAMIARAKMDELLLQAELPHSVPLQGQFDPRQTGWQNAGWRAMVRPFEAPPNAAPGVPILERIDVEIWWDSSGARRSFALEGFRRGVMKDGDAGVLP